MNGAKNFLISYFTTNDKITEISKLLNFLHSFNVYSIFQVVDISGQVLLKQLCSYFK